jgi:DNA-binding winged helix-turn-helix (wHTH) protein
VVTADDLETAVWGEAYVEDPERLKSVIKGLRRALGESADHLENVRGVGYMWRS